MRYTKLTLKLNSPHKPPYFMGSQLRGAFGYALKSLSPKLYKEFFTQKNSIHPYRFDIRLGMSRYEFSFYLFGDICDEVHVATSAFGKMVMEIGLGRDRKTYNDFHLLINDKIAYKSGKLYPFDEYEKKFKAKKHKKDLILHFITPLRMKKNGVFIRDSKVELRDILNSIYQRSRILKGKKHQSMPFDPIFTCRSKNIYFKDLTRKSFAQNSLMQLGGIMGEMWLSDLDKKSYELLKLGELIGVGKQCVFGLGKINIGGVK